MTLCPRPGRPGYVRYGGVGDRVGIYCDPSPSKTTPPRPQVRAGSVEERVNVEPEPHPDPGTAHACDPAASSASNTGEIVRAGQLRIPGLAGYDHDPAADCLHEPSVVSRLRLPSVRIT